MPHFTWTGHASTGATEGRLEAASASAVADVLQGRGITPLTIRAAAGGGGARGIDLSALKKLDWFEPKVRTVDLLLFSRQLNTLLRAGVPILRALAGLQESATNEKMKSTLAEVRHSLESGIALSMSLAQQGKVFDPFYVALVRVGEMTGRLDEVFLRLFHHLEFESAMRQQVKAALRYPIFVVSAMVVALGVINLMVIPAFAPVFEAAGTALPLPTRILMASSRFTIDWGWLMAIGAVAGFFALRAWRTTPDGRLRWDTALLKMPVAGKIVRKAMLARFARSFALSLKSGVPIAQALSVVAQTVDNQHIARKVEGMRTSVERGDSILRSAAAAGVFTPVVLQMIAVGEETGAVDELMDEVAELYGNEVQYELKTLGQQIEPILIVFLGVLVLMLALGVFLPVWDLGRTAMAH
ncbi:type II secretion system protein [Leptothrix cholodnii SP-6]|uniref:Type II secretion system protein n=1 Tax=Leptothrix cholodnii (strain ATCC 51168 / LMG 8142 / SP-6) TaxID=395495 RepID=B1Y077_LEPCP|nr:type II secretion system F family protein [Leptothrix cholodnii]ACB35358.1 type II secretion system protein [Leptothrix cholodnii SP-6]